MFHSNGRREPEPEFSPPPALDGTIRVIVCTSGSRDEITGRVQRAIGEYSGADDELHVSHALAPDLRTNQMLYSVLIVLRPSARIR